MIKTLKLRKWGEGYTTDPTILEITFTLIAHPYRSVGRAYEVSARGRVRGTIYRVRENTDRQYNKIRIPGKGRPAWGWRSEDGQRSNSPGLYANNMALAAAQLLGYDDADEVKS